MSLLVLLPYVGLILALLFFYFLRTKGAYNMMVATLVVFSAIRYNVGSDYPVYVYLLKNQTAADAYQFEWLSQLIVDFSVYMENIYLFFLINALCFIIPIAWVLKRESSKPKASLLVLALFPMFLLKSFVYTRNYSAFAFVFLGLYFFVHRKYFWALLLGILATGFHISACIFPLIYFVSRFRISGARIYRYFFITILLLFLAPYLVRLLQAALIPLNLGFKNYLLESTQGAFYKPMFLLVFLLILLNYTKGEQIRRAEMPYLSVVVMGMLVFAALSPLYSISRRVLLFFFMGLLVLVPRLVGREGGVGAATLGNWVSRFYFASIFILILGVEYRTHCLGVSQYLPYETVFSHWGNRFPVHDSRVPDIENSRTIKP